MASFAIESASRAGASRAAVRTAARWRRNLIGLALATLGAASAHAGLFDDEEARKAILDLRSRIQANDDAARARSNEQSNLLKDLADQQQQSRRQAVELNTQIEALRAESTKLRGLVEQLQRDLGDTQRKLQDAQTAAAATSQRVAALEPQKVQLDGREVTVDAVEKRAYDQAMATLREGDFDRASAALASFLQRHPSSGYVDSARYWLGAAQYGQKNHKDAIATFRALIAASPNHPRAAEAQLTIANSQIETKDVKAARKTLEDLLKLYPSSEAAGAARERLATLK